MAKVLVGKLSVFNHELQDWEVFKDRLEQWFIANEITNVEDKSQIKRRAVLVSSLSENTYKLVRDLALPEKISTLDYDKVTKLLDDHFKPIKCGFAERYLFHSSTQHQNETLTEWAARVRSLATDCDFPATTLNEALRDRFVLGMLPGRERDKLFTMALSEVSLSKAISIAEALRCARLGAARGVSTPLAAAEAPAPVFKVAAATGSGGASTAASEGAMRDPCTACGYKGHEISTCKFVKYKCTRCGLKGHLRRVCPKKNVVKHNFIECSSNEDEVSEDDGECIKTISNIRSINGEPMHESVIVDGIHLEFELDSGSPITIIPRLMYKKYFSKVPLKRSKLVLNAYNGTSISTLGIVTLPVSYSSKCYDLDIYVASSEGAPLLGRDFFSKFSLKISMVHSCNFLNEFIPKYPQLFSDKLGCCKTVRVTLNMKPDAQPKFFKPRPLPFALRARVDQELNRLVDLGILEQVNYSEYASPIVPVLKHDGKIRLCADYSVSLNKQLIIDQYPLPRIEELFAKLHGGKKFSKLDLSQAYNQLVLDEPSQMLTCINTHKGIYKFKRLVFGLSSSAAIFQKTIESILSGIDNILVYQDDILITGCSDTQHIETLKKVFSKLEEAGLVLQKEKCSLFQDSVSYLGFVVDRYGLHKCPEKVKAIENAKTPTNVLELKSFLGLVNYYRSFVKNASSILYPLHQLLQKNTPWHWTDAHDKAVSTIKYQLSADETLAHFDPNAELILTVDASPTGLGAILSQIEDGKERPLSYASRSLAKAERNYSQIQKEATAIIFGVRKYHQYLYGRPTPFILKTDHKPLLSIFNPSKGVPEVSANRLQRYAIFLSSYNFVIEYVSSTLNTADFLSRSTIDQPTHADEVPYIDRATYVNFVFDSPKFLTMENIVSRTKNDPVLSRVCEYIINGWPPTMKDDRIKPYFSCRQELSVEGSCLLRGYRIIVPSSCREQVLCELHTGHLGTYKMKSEARTRFWWPHMSADIDTVIASCKICVAARATPPRAPLTPWPFPPQPWYRVHLDFLGPINNHTYLVIVDAYSKWIECFDVSTGYGTRVVIEKLCEVMSRFGLFHTICTDNGTSFVSEEFKHFCNKNSIVHVTSPTYHPMSNGQAESSVKIVKKAIKAIIMSGYNQKDLKCKLQEFLFSYRNSAHSTTNKSPAEILFNRKLRCRLDLVTLNKPLSLDARLDALVKDKQSLQTRYYDGKRIVNFENEETVLVKIPHLQKYSWVKGVITKKLGNSMYEVRISDSGVVIRKHTNQLLKFKGEKWYENFSANEPAPEPQFMPAFVVRDEAKVVSSAPTVDTQSQIPDPTSPVHQPSMAIEENAWHTPTAVPQEVSRECEQPAPGTSTTMTPRRTRKVIDYKKFF